MARNLPVTKKDLNFFQRIRLNRVIRRLDNERNVEMSSLPDYIRENEEFLSVYAKKGNFSGVGSIDDHVRLASYSTRLLEKAWFEAGDYGDKLAKAVFEREPEVLSQLITANRGNEKMIKIGNLLKQNDCELLKSYPQVIKQLIEIKAGSSGYDMISDEVITNLLKRNPKIFEAIYPKEQSIWDKPNPPYSMDRFEEKKHHDAMQEWFRRNFKDLPENQRNEYLKYADIATQISLFKNYPEVYPNIKEEAILQKAKEDEDRFYHEGWHISFASDVDGRMSGGISAIPSIMRFLPNDTQLKLLKINQDYLDLASEKVKEIYVNGNPLLGARVENKKIEDLYLGGIEEGDPELLDSSTLVDIFPEAVYHTTEFDVKRKVDEFIKKRVEEITGERCDDAKVSKIRRKLGVEALFDEKICQNEACREELIDGINRGTGFRLESLVKKAYGVECLPSDGLYTKPLCLFDSEFNERFSYDKTSPGWYINAVASFAKHPERVEEYDRFCDLIMPADARYAEKERNVLSPDRVKAFYAARDLVHSLDEEPTRIKLQSEKEELTPEENEQLGKKRAEMLTLAVFDRVSDNAYRGTLKVRSSRLPFPKTLDELENYAQKRQEFYREAVEKATDPETVARLITDCYSRQNKERNSGRPMLGDTRLDTINVKKLKDIFKRLDTKLQPGQSFEELSNNDKDKIFYGEDKER